MKIFLVFTLTENFFATIIYSFNFFSGLWIMQIRSINYSFHFESIKIRKHCLYWKVFSTDIYWKIFFNTLLYLCFVVCLLVNCMSWVSKFHNFFLTYSETEARFIFEGFKYCSLWKFHFHFSGTFLAFFIWSVNCSREFLSHFVCQ